MEKAKKRKPYKYNREYFQRPDVKRRIHLWKQRPEVKARNAFRSAEHRKKPETIAKKK